MLYSGKHDPPEQKNPVRTSPPNRPTIPTPLNLDESTDDSVLNRVLQLRSMPRSRSPKGKQGIVYYDSTNKKIKIYIDEVGKWADILYTTTSTSTSTSTTTT